jgi:hypothetical protein
MDNAYNFVKEQGITFASDYPYKAVKQECLKTTGDFKISDFGTVKSCSELTIAL